MQHREGFGVFGIDLAGKRVVAIVPHQDDEIIGMGGQIAYACRENATVFVVLVTDGAADGAAKTVCGIDPCLELAGFGEPGNPGRVAHDKLLIIADNGRSYHPHGRAPRFVIERDPERKTGFACDGWGRQRNFEFLHVCQALGVRPANVMLAYWNHRAPERIKDGQTHLRGVELTMDGMKERYARVAEFYFRKLLPDVVLTMAPYEYTPPPNDHWACAHGVMEAATRCDIVHVYYSHSGIVYQHVHHGSAYLGRRVELKPSIWEAKIKALGQYMRWEPENGWYATALHSVPKTFHALLSGCGRHEYINDHPDW